ncbi:MAG: c-type cytochrome, partial [Gammaproteobacteria bacterium]|nr:c-type cytochrome [Gammaproteobacteria bacterium]
KKSIYDQYCSGCHGAEGRGGTEEGVRGASTSSITRAISSERDMNFLSGLTDQYIRAISDYLNGDSNGTIQIPALGGGGATDGLALYGTNCSGCHGAAPGTKSGRTAQQIQNAINTVGAMSGLTGLTAAEVQSIADAIATGGGGGGGGGTTPPDGATLYANNCSGCHGNAPGTKAGRTAQQIQNAINTVGAMSGLTGLTAAEVQAIADAIATGGGGGGGGGTTPPDGATLYADNCSGCHGNAPGTKAGRTAQQIQSAINTVGAMSGLTGLTAAEVQAIADAIATGGGGGGGGGTTPPDGTTLYADNCSGCHGNAPGTKAGRTAQQIQSAINSVGAMSGLTGLTATEVQAIADAIGGTNAPPTTPEGLFTSYCSACHGIDGRGGVGGNVRGSSASDIQRAINSERDMNYLSGLLAESTIQSIADYLGGGTSTRTTTRRRSREDGQAGNGTPSTAGGCSLGSNAPFDPLLPLLVLSGLGYLFRRPARQQG